MRDYAEERALYVAMRRRAEFRPPELYEIDEIEETLADLANTLREWDIKRQRRTSERSIAKATQTMRDTANVIRKRLQQLSEAYRRAAAYDDSQDVAFLEREFDALLALPSVTDITIHHKELDVHVTAQIPFGPMIYDAGDWVIRFGDPERQEPWVGNTRSGVLTGALAPGREHMYHFPAGDYGYYCVGNQRASLWQFMSRGDFFGAVSLVVEALSHVNDDARYLIPSSFVPLEVHA